MFMFISLVFVFLAHVVCSEEIIMLRNVKPTTGERRDASNIPSIEKTPNAVEGANTNCDEESTPVNTEDSAIDSDADDSKPAATKSAEKNDGESGNSSTKSADEEPKTETREGAGDESKDDDSNEATGKEEAAEQDRDMMEDGDEKSDDDEVVEVVDTSSADKVTSMFQKILALGGHGQSGQAVVKVNDDDAPGQDGM